MYKLSFVKFLIGSGLGVVAAIGLWNGCARAKDNGPYIKGCINGITRVVTDLGAEVDVERATEYCTKQAEENKD